MFNRTRTNRDASVGERRAELVASFDEAIGEPATTQPGTQPGNQSGNQPETGAGTQPGTPPAGSPRSGFPSSIEEHTTALRATRDAHQQAQRMLAEAASARSEATDQAEQIVVEARAAADRLRDEAEREAEALRKETADWTAAQRSKVDGAVGDLLDTAHGDADRIRTEAMRAAMAEAEDTARLYISEAAARGARDAEETRSRARELLQRATVLGTETQGDLQEVTSALAALADGLQQRMTAIDQLLDEIRAQDAVAQLPVDAVVLPMHPVFIESTGPADDESPADGDEVGESADHADHAGRQLGSLFRDSNATD